MATLDSGKDEEEEGGRNERKTFRVGRSNGRGRAATAIMGTKQRSVSLSAAFSRPHGRRMYRQRAAPQIHPPGCVDSPLGDSASHRPIPDNARARRLNSSRYGSVRPGPGLKKTKALISNVGYVDLEREVESLAAFRAETAHKEIGEELKKEGGAIELGG